MADPGMPSAAEIRAVARTLLRDALGTGETGGRGVASSQRELINESHVIAARDQGGVLMIPPGAIVTPLARDAAERFNVELRSGAAPHPAATTPEPDAAEPSPREQGGKVAIGSDHGGWKLKELLKKHLTASGFDVKDEGTTSEAPCDYPDLAARVGRAIALGEARWGVFVDGAGIGGAMTLNKVPGVFAATCHDTKAAENARGHNRANVLCLGAGWLDEAKARAVVDAFMGKGFEGGRHAKRVAKIAAVERAFVGRMS